MIIKAKTKQPAFEIFRALAVSMVLVGHFSDAAQDLPIAVKKTCFAFGYYGIPLFFIISGFLLTASFVSILKNRQSQFALASKIFMLKRMLRIFPAYLVSLLIFSLYFNASAYDFLLHFFNVHNLVEGFNRSINVVYWTLAVEFQWYIVAPLLIMLFIKVSIKQQVIVLALFIIISVILRFYFFNEYLNHKYSLASLVWIGNDQLYIHVYNFLLGVFLVAGFQFRNIQIKPHRLLMCFLMLVLFVIGYIESDLITGINHYNEQATQIRIILAYVAILVLSFVVFVSLHVKLSKNSYRLIAFISLISYSLYLYHLPLLNYIDQYNLVWYLYLPTFLASSIFVAAISYYLIEAPFLRYSSGLARK